MSDFVNLAKAFNTVNHVILLVKLIKQGITDTLLSWCRSYLSNRPQCTIANNKLSNPELVSCGVAQGSIFSPLFFLVYINDLMSSLKSVSVQMYADGKYYMYQVKMGTWLQRRYKLA